MSLLDGEVPYTMAIGNHDLYPKESFDRSKTLFNDYFSLSDNPLNAITTERIAGDLANTYSKFTGPDGRKTLILSLEFLPRASVFEWASSVIDQNPDYTAIVLTHANLLEGAAVNGEPVTTREPVGNTLWHDLTKRHANIEMVLNGHSLDQDDTDPFGRLTTARQSSIGVHGNTVHEMGFNSQQQPNGGNGYLRILEFLDDRTTVNVKTYSPFLDVWLSDSRNEFQVQLTQLPALNADFNSDTDVDGSDFLIWQQGFNIGTALAQGDANSSSSVDGNDLAIWQQSFSSTPLPPQSTDFDHDADVDGSDFLIWQQGHNFGTTQPQGDANSNSRVNGDDLTTWRQFFGSTSLPQPSADFDSDADNDGRDFLTWQQGFGSGTTFAQGDTNGDNSVNGEDRIAWELTFGSTPNTTLSSYSTLPEPASCSLALVAVLAIALARQLPQNLCGRFPAKSPEPQRH